MKQRWVFSCGFLLIGLGIGYYLVGKSPLRKSVQKAETIESRVAALGAKVDRRWRPWFQRAGLPYPPERILLLGLKEENRLEVYASGEAKGPLRWVRSFPVLKASGTRGPKLREGDRQVPEGIYGIEYLNPNSLYHLSMKVSYPNAFDRHQAAAEGRTNLGGDIMIHGKASSIGCLAMGDEVAENLFILAARSGIEKIEVVLSPVDFRVDSRLIETLAEGQPKWVASLYETLKQRVSALPLGERDAAE